VENLLIDLDREIASTRRLLERYPFGKPSAPGSALVSESRAMLMRLMVINHLVHHRVQLGVFLRLLSVPKSTGRRPTNRSVARSWNGTQKWASHDEPVANFRL
jgi:hypothetical protein